MTSRFVQQSSNPAERPSPAPLGWLALNLSAPPAPISQSLTRSLHCVRSSIVSVTYRSSSPFIPFSRADDDGSDSEAASTVIASYPPNPTDGRTSE